MTGTPRDNSALCAVRDSSRNFVLRRAFGQVPGLLRPLALSLTGVLCTLCPIGVLAQDSGSSLSCRPQFLPADGDYQFTGVEHPELTADGSNDEMEIERIYFSRLPIFNTANDSEDNWLFRWANNFHLLTRESTIRQQLLFNEGETVPVRLLEETARLLRRQGYFHDVDVRPVSRCGDSIDVEVITKDNWSLTPTLAFDNVGGESTYSIGMRDSNLLGRGKLLALKRGKELDRQSTELLYQDNNVLGSRLRNRVSLMDSSDGDTRAFDLDLPFYSLDTRFAWAVRLLDQERLDTQYARGVEVSEVRHDIEDYTAELGFSSGLSNGVTRRWRLGFRHQQDRFALSDELPPPDIFPAERQMDYLFVGFEAVEDRYATAFNLDQIYRTEDLHLGFRVNFSAGYASKVFGSDQHRLILRGSFHDSLLFSTDSYWQHELEWEGFYNQDSKVSEDVLVRYEHRYFHRQTERYSFFARAEAVYGKNLNSHRQTVLGGTTGARGFENRFQTGDSRFLLSLEERWYSDIHLFNLVRLGAAVFVDTGRVWTDDPDVLEDSTWLANVGFGLRLASSKAASNRIAHLDFAFPLTHAGEQGVEDFLVNFTIKGRF